MQRKLWMLVAVAAVMVIAAGCSQLGPQASPVPPTKTPKPTFTWTPDWTATPVVFPTATPEPATPTPEATNTPEPTPEPPTATPAPEARFTANQAANIRSGPGTAYAAIGRLAAGDSYVIDAVNPARDWYRFTQEGRAGWVTAELVTVTGDLNVVEVAQNIAPPPTARPTARPAPTQPPQPTAPPAPTQPATPYFLLKGVERCDPNPGQTYFNGFVRDRNNNLLNGVCVHIAYYGPRVTKCSGCDGVGNGVWGFSPFGGPAPAGVTVEIFVVKCPASMPPGGATKDTPGGFADLTPQSDKWVRTINASEQCTGITFIKN